MTFTDDEDSDLDLEPSDELVSVYNRKLTSLSEIMDSIYNKADDKKMLQKLTVLSQ